jgi:hypothetical protein
MPFESAVNSHQVQARLQQKEKDMIGRTIVLKLNISETGGKIITIGQDIETQEVAMVHRSAGTTASAASQVARTSIMVSNRNTRAS